MLSAEHVDILSVPNFAGKDRLHAFELSLPPRHFNSLSLVQVEFCHLGEFRGGQMNLDGAAVLQPHDDVRAHSAADGTLPVSQVINRPFVNRFGGGVVSRSALLWAALRKSRQRQSQQEDS